MYRNQYDKDGTAAAMGDAAQQRFDEVVESFDGKSIPSTIDEDIHKHIDRHVELYGREFTVDVKSAKATRRDGTIVIDEVWIELLNVQGKPGWIFGEQDFVAFELKKHNFIVVPRLELAKLCRELIDTSTTVNSPEEALYKAYRREGRNDIISRIKLDDIKDNITYMMLRK